MLRNYLTVSFRNLLKHKVYSFLNIGGLSVGMAVAMLIGLWMYDEFSYNRYHKNYDRIARVMQHNIYNGNKESQVSNPAKMAEEILANYGSDFKYVLQSSWTNTHILKYGDKTLSTFGNYFEPAVTDMLSLRMLKGTRNGLQDPYSVLLSESVAKAVFGNADPMNKVIKLNNKYDVKVTGVYEDIPYNSEFRELNILLPWELYLIHNDWIQKMNDPWDSNFTQTFAQLAEHADVDQVSAKIKNVKYNKINQEDKRYKPEVFLHPMNKWHLYSEFKNGVNVGGRIQFVRLFGIIGIFVLLLACINFMNLATARSEKRAKEVGIRKTLGSIREQLIFQFFSESVLVSVLAFFLALFLVQFSLPFFNEVADKKMTVLWLNPLFWLASISFILLTGIIAGSYPALYLSSFQPVKVLKGTFRAGRFAAIPRKALVVLQFTVSVTLIIGTIVVFRQIQHAKNRPIGYDRNGLIQVDVIIPEIHNHFEVVRTELKSQGAIVEMTESTSPTTEVWNTNGGFNWEGKDPNLAIDFPNSGVTYEFGKTVGWQFKEGRDFSRDFATDSAAFVINEAMVKFIGLKNPVGTQIKWNNKPFTIIGVIKDMVVQSPYQPVRASLFHLSNDGGNVILAKLNPAKTARESLAKIEQVFKKYNPASPFEYKFVDEQYAKKFGDEERIGKLAGVFAGLAILISCLGLFGLASFTAEQRIKEIGVRKVLGASVMDLWLLLSKDFVRLVIVSLLVAIPIAYFLMYTWLQRYEYRSGISWWIFAMAAIGALLITLLTVSYQAIKAALANPVKSLRNE
ncbi:FtsX-like permease family protein [Rhodocytophaga rosea]|uniref:FtsX-like permease family protein n=1 Tax=Rhodocytophaga rosea TaxID=2704465 RepID=A0A6C0GMF1_9BACT|nr:ABC transporter permease [Rhodocytophaga rosea]QHT69218.1 FtsX-like permease family protein [Rhodocytophaga rosea]